MEQRRCLRCFELKPWGPHLLNFCEECVRAEVAQQQVLAANDAARESIRAELAKLSPRPGDVLLLTLPAPTDAHGDLADKHLAQRLAEATGCFVLLLRPYEGLALMDEAKMAAAGWVRAQAPLTNAAKVHVLQEAIGCDPEASEQLHMVRCMRLENGQWVALEDSVPVPALVEVPRDA